MNSRVVVTFASRKTAKCLGVKKTLTISVSVLHDSSSVTFFGQVVQLVFADVIQVFLHVSHSFGNLTKGELLVDQDFGYHWLWGNAQHWKILQKC